MNGGGRRILGIPLSGRQDRDEDLLLFKELHKREKDRIASLLQPVSDEFEPNAGGNYALYRISSGKKGSGYEFFGENNKNDYDWLKTPPATPLFPSLEMEANAPQLAIQREIPIIQPLSRFAGNSEALKISSMTPKSPTSKPKIPARSVTPNQRKSIQSIQIKNPIKATPTPNQKMDRFLTNLNKGTNTTKPPIQKVPQTNFLAANLAKNTGPELKTKPRSRGVSPSVRSTIPAQIPGFTNETPPNLRTDRSTSATRGRPAATNPTISIQQKPEASTRPRRQSCSPSVTRGRKESAEGNLTTPKGKIQAGSHNGAHIFGSKMVEKVMNARKFGTEEKQAKPKPDVTPTTAAAASSTPSYGRMMPKSSLDMAFKHMEMKRDRFSSRPHGPVRGRSTTREE